MFKPSHYHLDRQQSQQPPAVHWALPNSSMGGMEQAAASYSSHGLDSFTRVQAIETGSCSVVQAAVELTAILPPQPPEGWDFRHLPSHTSCWPSLTDMIILLPDR